MKTWIILTLAIGVMIMLFNVIKGFLSHAYRREKMKDQLNELTQQMQSMTKLFNEKILTQQQTIASLESKLAEVEQNSTAVIGSYKRSMESILEITDNIVNFASEMTERLKCVYKLCSNPKDQRLHKKLKEFAIRDIQIRKDFEYEVNQLYYKKMQLQQNELLKDAENANEFKDDLEYEE